VGLPPRGEEHAIARGGGEVEGGPKSYDCTKTRVLAGQNCTINSSFFCERHPELWDGYTLYNVDNILDGAIMILRKSVFLNLIVN
jgi:hypothetical protein